MTTWVATDGRRLAHALAQELHTVGEPLPPATHLPGDRSRVLAPVIGMRSLRALVGLLEKLKGGDSELSLAWTVAGFLQVEALGL